MQRRVERNKIWLTISVWPRSLMLQALLNLGPSVSQLIQNVGLETEQIRGWCAETIGRGKFELISIKRENKSVCGIFLFINYESMLLSILLSILAESSTLSSRSTIQPDPFKEFNGPSGPTDPLYIQNYCCTWSRYYKILKWPQKEIRYQKILTIGPFQTLFL